MSDKIVEWELTMKCNFDCAYCTNLNQNVLPILNRDEIKKFIKMLGETYPGVEIFLFGGEPFLHPDIEFIIKTFNEYEVPFVIQTNYSNKSVVVMNRITEPFKINMSIHPTEISLKKLMPLFSKRPNNAELGIIDVMYTGTEAIKYYLDIKKELDDYMHIYLTPIADFGDGESTAALLEYNSLREREGLSKLIRFERAKFNGEYRSKLWADPNFIIKNKPCLYNDRYFLYSADLSLNNCCYREIHDGMCRHDKCFLM